MTVDGWDSNIEDSSMTDLCEVVIEFYVFMDSEWVYFDSYGTSNMPFVVAFDDQIPPSVEL
jgi:hypothetical protein